MGYPAGFWVSLVMLIIALVGGGLALAALTGQFDKSPPDLSNLDVPAAPDGDYATFPPCSAEFGPPCDADGNPPNLTGRKRVGLFALFA